MRVWGDEGAVAVSVSGRYTPIWFFRPCVWRVCVYMCVCVDGITLKWPSLVSRERGKVEGKFVNQIKGGSVDK